MFARLNKSLTHKNGVVRKASAALLRIPHSIARLQASPAQYLQRPPILVNSFPKSGTHLLVQIAEGLPHRVNYGAFLASMTSSFQFRERSPDNAGRVIRSFVPGEIVRGHLFFHPQNAEELSTRNVVHYFIYRDPRDVVVSEAHYLRFMNRWHRLASFFRQLDSIEKAISLSIRGFEPPRQGLEYPSIAARFSRYAGWLTHPECFCVRFEDLRAMEDCTWLLKMSEFYAARCDHILDPSILAESMKAHISPEKSHTFRSGKKSGWQTEFTPEHRRIFNDVAGDLLIELGYEPNHDWVEASARS